jgi:AcrR family transcriptional regulator
MSTARADLLDLVIAEVAEHGLGDRSLRDIAAAIGSSHRMLLYHFGSRQALVASIVHATEQRQRDLMGRLAEQTVDPRELVLTLWDHLASEQMRPFVRLFFETLAATSAEDPSVTESWVEEGERVAAALGVDFDALDVRLGTAVTRGLLIDVLATGDTEAATAALRRFVERWPFAMRPNR